MGNPTRLRFFESSGDGDSRGPPRLPNVEFLETRTKSEDTNEVLRWDIDFDELHHESSERRKWREGNLVELTV